MIPAELQNYLLVSHKFKILFHVYRYHTPVGCLIFARRLHLFYFVFRPFNVICYCQHVTLFLLSFHSSYLKVFSLVPKNCLCLPRANRFIIMVNKKMEKRKSQKTEFGPQILLATSLSAVIVLVLLFLSIFLNFF